MEKPFPGRLENAPREAGVRPRGYGWSVHEGACTSGDTRGGVSLLDQEKAGVGTFRGPWVGVRGPGPQGQSRSPRKVPTLKCV